MKNTYDYPMVDRIRELLIDEKNVEELEMFKGLCFMVNSKMFIFVDKDDIMCRIGEDAANIELESGSCLPHVVKSKTVKDFVIVELEQLQTRKRLQHWINLCLKYNPVAKQSKKKIDKLK